MKKNTGSLPALLQHKWARQSTAVIPPMYGRDNGVRILVYISHFRTTNAIIHVPFTL
jgi:hypothetical protein